MSWNVAILWKLCLCLISFYQFSINVIDANTVDFQSNDHGFNDSYKMLRGYPDRWKPSGYCENLQWKYSGLIRMGQGRGEAMSSLPSNPTPSIRWWWWWWCHHDDDDDDDDNIVKINDVHDDAGTRASAKQAWVGRVLRKLHILNQSHRWDIENSISLPWCWSTIRDQWSFLFQATFQRSFRLRFIAAE